MESFASDENTYRTENSRKKNLYGFVEFWCDEVQSVREVSYPRTKLTELIFYSNFTDFLKAKTLIAPRTLQNNFCMDL